MKTTDDINCARIQKEIFASGEFLSPMVETHCKECDFCRKIKEDWQLLRDTKDDPKIPLANDFAIITAAHKLGKSRRIQVAIRRFLGYTAATASGIAAIYTVIFNVGGQIPNAENEMLSKAWDWDKFEEKIFVLNTAAEISRQDIKFESWEIDKTVSKEQHSDESIE